jgi:hypothetical protein
MRISLAIIALFATACSSTGQSGSKQSSSSDSAFISNGINTIGGILGGKGKSSSSLSNTEIIAGLKQALEKGAQISGDKLSTVDGYFANAALKILMPEEAKKVESTLRSMGMGNLVDDAILSMNRAAEDAAKSAAPIFINAIKTMSINDALGILKGTDTAATAYLRGKTTSPLTEAFRPVVESSLKKVDATKYWNLVFTNYNRFALNKINPDLTAFVTERALSGIFLQLGQEEKEIRKNPLARTTELLKKVFGSI